MSVAIAYGIAYEMYKSEVQGILSGPVGDLDAVARVSTVRTWVGIEKDLKGHIFSIYGTLLPSRGNGLWITEN